MGNSSDKDDRPEETGEDVPVYYDHEEVKFMVDPGDLIFFAGSDFVSGFIRFCQKRLAKKVDPKTVPSGTFSHVGMVVTSEILNHPKIIPGHVYVFESTMSGKLGGNVPNIDGLAFFGTQLRDYEILIPKYLASSSKDKKCKIAVGKLRNNPFISSNSKTRRLLKNKFSQVFHTYNNISYDANVFSLAGAGWSCCRPARDDMEDLFNTTDWLFCSELIAVIYKELGIIPYDIDPKNVLPMDFLGYDTDTVGKIPNDIIDHNLLYIKDDV